MIFWSQKCLFRKCTFLGPQLSRGVWYGIFLIREKPALRVGLIIKKKNQIYEFTLLSKYHYDGSRIKCIIILMAEEILNSSSNFAVMVTAKYELQLCDSCTQVCNLIHISLHFTFFDPSTASFNFFI